MSVLDEGTVRLMRQTQLVNYHNVAALVFLLWDTIITFGDEVEYIWPQYKGSPTKWVFLFTRYFGLMAQARLVSLNLTLSFGIFSIDICRMIYTTQVIFGGILMACAQSFLMLRVYALYTQNRRIAFSMIALLVAEIGAMPGAIKMTMPTDPGPLCMKPIKARDIAFFGVSALLPQLIVVGLTVIKFFSGLRAGWGKIPIVSRLVRDDIILVTVIAVWVVICTSLNSINTIYGYIGYTWLISLIPSVGCRVVINMQRLAKEQNGPFGQGHFASTSSPQLTSCIFDVTEGEASSNSIAGSRSRKPRVPESGVFPNSTESQISTSEGIKAVPRDRNREQHDYGTDEIVNSDLLLGSANQARSNSYFYPTYGHSNAQSPYTLGHSLAHIPSKSLAPSTILQHPPSSISPSHLQVEPPPPPPPPPPLMSPLHHGPSLTRNSAVAVARMQIMIRSK